VHFQALFDSLRSNLEKNAQQSHSRSGVVKEFQEYINLCPRPTTNVIQFWEEHKSRFPMLAQVAFSILAIPASSGASERMFSKAGWLSGDRKNRLNGENFRSQVFLSGNLSTLKFCVHR
jgi:hAT family C-terminal dimerisation region